MKKLKPYAITALVALAVVVVVFRLIPANWRTVVTNNN